MSNWLTTTILITITALTVSSHSKGLTNPVLLALLLRIKVWLDHTLPTPNNDSGNTVHLIPVEKQKQQDSEEQQTQPKDPHQCQLAAPPVVVTIPTILTGRPLNRIDLNSNLTDNSNDDDDHTSNTYLANQLQKISIKNGALALAATGGGDSDTFQFPQIPSFAAALAGTDDKSAESSDSNVRDNHAVLHAGARVPKHVCNQAIDFSFDFASEFRRRGTQSSIKKEEGEGEGEGPADDDDDDSATSLYTVKRVLNISDMHLTAESLDSLVASSPEFARAIASKLAAAAA